MMTVEEKIDIHKHIIQNDIINEIEKINEGRGELKQVDLAKILGVSKSFVSQLYASNKFFNLEQLAKIQMNLNLKMTIKFEDINKLRTEINSFNFTSTSYGQDNKNQIRKNEIIKSETIVYQQA